MLPTAIGHESRSARLPKAVCERPRVPVECRETADAVAFAHGNIYRSSEMDAAQGMAAGATGSKVGEMNHAARLAAVTGWVNSRCGESA